MSSSNAILNNLFSTLFSESAGYSRGNEQMEEIFRNIMNRTAATAAAAAGATNNNDISANHASNNSNNSNFSSSSLTNNNDELFMAFRDYNHNIGEFIYYNYSTQQLRDYNNNVKNFLEIIRSQNRYLYRSPSRTVHTQTYGVSAHSGRSPAAASIHLTEHQIQNAVRNIFYDETVHTEPRCPITLADFENGESISQIITCGHIFKREPLSQHFRRGERLCPICRVDVTHSVNRSGSDAASSEAQSVRVTEPLTTTIPLSELSDFLRSNPTLQDFSRLFQNASSDNSAVATPSTTRDTSSSQNLIFQFEIPIPELD
jgi:hypothetical protein